MFASRQSTANLFEAITLASVIPSAHITINEIEYENRHTVIKELMSIKYLSLLITIGLAPVSIPYRMIRRNLKKVRIPRMAVIRTTKR
jgi:hypothetical protein